MEWLAPNALLTPLYLVTRHHSDRLDALISDISAWHMRGQKIGLREGSKSKIGRLQDVSLRFREDSHECGRSMEREAAAHTVLLAA